MSPYQMYFLFCPLRTPYLLYIILYSHLYHQPYIANLTCQQPSPRPYQNYINLARCTQLHHFYMTFFQAHAAMFAHLHAIFQLHVLFHSCPIILVLRQKCVRVRPTYSPCRNPTRQLKHHTSPFVVTVRIRSLCEHNAIKKNSY